MLDFAGRASTPARNIELKLKVADPARVKSLAIAAGAQPVTTLWQRDTYFQVPRGRLKLREEAGAPANLIWYDRADEAASRLSRYYLLPAPEPARLLEAFREAFGVRVVVHKRRDLLQFQNVRIHLDTVEHLGDFLELEAVLAPEDAEDAGQAIVNHLLGELEMSQAPVVAHSYAGLLLEQKQGLSSGV
ncbi:MAG: class IV adenylate cyclase [Planctomycetota bacterium]